MGSALKKKRAMRSRRSGVKKKQQMDSNWQILKKLGFFGILISFFLISCMPVRVVDISSRHNYYERHRYNSYTSPIWIPGHGVVLQTYRVRVPRALPPMNRGRH